MDPHLPPGDRDSPEHTTEDEQYLTRQIVTYIGNKRALLDFIGAGIRKVRARLNKKKLASFDVFSGSGIVARFLKQFSHLVIVNDLETYSAVINRCYLSNYDDLDIKRLQTYHREILMGLGESRLEGGIISELYAPKDENCIRADDRVFYTVRNARYIDTARRLIGELPENDQVFFLAPLLAEASLHANTSGVFKGFYKNRETGIGQYGGKNRDALLRITGHMELPFPVFSRFHTGTKIYQGDSNAVVKDAPEVDFAYLDPPYNQHPYGSNYFMLNLIADYQYPANISPVSGIPPDWNRSGYNAEKQALPALRELVSAIKAKYILLSFNSEGFISLAEMKKMLHEVGKVEVLETTYNTFKGSRNLNSRNIHVKEYLYLVEK
ncbi:MAG: DNA adenine methylase [Treponema sp.]|jgi:adenine-specific DNA-methyltransferase|nr:DNA adenine methylase [Treponema sp.]